MTSSLSLQKRKERPDLWTFGDPETSTLGGWEDHYITPGHTHECAPGFKATPIGNPYGFMVCTRINTEPQRPCNSIDYSSVNGYNRYSSDLYNPKKDFPRQVYNPDYYSDRRTPNERILIQRDYLHLPIKFNATGITPIHTPTDSNTPYPPGYFEYGYSSNTCPPYVYDVTRAVQAYPVWRNMQQYNQPTKPITDLKLKGQYQSP